MEWRQIADRVVDLGVQRTLRGFEQSLKQLWPLFGIDAWATLLPPSFQAGDRPLFVGHGVKPNSPSLGRAVRGGLEELAANSALIEPIAHELAPQVGCSWRMLQVGETRVRPMFLLFYRLPQRPTFTAEELDALAWAGGQVRRCFQVLAAQQEQEFMVGLFRLVSNLHPEGICVLDATHRLIFENRNFREHLLQWEHGAAALQNLNLPKATALPAEWLAASKEALEKFNELSVPDTTTRLVVSQGPIVSLLRPISDETEVRGAVRYLALRSSLGLRPYLLLTSSIAQTVAGTVQTLARLAEKTGLSRREKEMAALILEGCSADEIAARLRIALPTVKTHIRNILRKAGVKTRLQFQGLFHQR